MPRTKAVATTKTKPVVAKKAAQRSGIYRPEFCDQAYNYGLLGFTEVEIAREIGVSARTIFVWKKKHPAFLAALKSGGAIADSKVARSLYERAIGYEYYEEAVARIKTVSGEGKDKVVTEGVKIVRLRRFAPPDTASMAIWLRNRRAVQWRERKEIEVTGSLEHRLSAMSPEERAAWSEDLARRAARLLEAPMIEGEVVETAETDFIDAEAAE